MTSRHFKAVAEIITDRYGLEEDRISPALHLQKDLGADSLDVTEMVMLLEDRLNITIPDQEMRHLKTVGDLTDCIDRYLL